MGSTKNGRDSNPKFLGAKLADGQQAKTGQIIYRQRGNKIW
ncbi:50S ribosomal protein L27, partial [Mycoplasmoides gallisepticum]